MDKYEEAIGNCSIQALQKGGEDLLDKIDGALGPALRHLQRIREGKLALVPGVEREIQQSIARAQALLL